MSFQVRRAQLEDFELVKRLFREAREESPEYRVFEISESKADKSIRTMLIQPHWFVFLLGEQGMIVFHAETPWFSNDLGLREDILYVSPESRGKGLVQQLLSKLDEVSTSLKARWIIAGSSMHPERSSGVESLYRRQGFKTVGTILSKGLPCSS